MLRAVLMSLSILRDEHSFVLGCYCLLAKVAMGSETAHQRRREKRKGVAISSKIF